jgi:hypothetical protein
MNRENNISFPCAEPSLASPDDQILLEEFGEIEWVQVGDM